MLRYVGVLLASSLSSGSGVSLLTHDLGASLKERPIMKVVRLLQDMTAELEHELEDDKAVHQKLSCWCKENDQQKSKAIAVGEAKAAELETFLAEAAAKMKELQAKHEEALAEVNQNFEALSKAQGLRMKESQAFHAEEVDLVEAIKACEGAITVLKEYHSSPTDLAQVRTVAQRLQHAQVLDLAKRSMNAPQDSQLRALSSFLNQAQAPSFLTVPGYAAYAPQSGEIYGILEQMKEEFEHDLQGAQAREKQAIEDFLALKTAKEAEIAAGRKLITELASEIADLKVKHAEAFKELEDTQAQLALDREFLANLKKKCSESAEEFEARVQDRMDEMAAVSDTIGILNSDAAFNNFDKTVNIAFFQAGLGRRVHNSKLEQQRLQKAARFLQKAGAGLDAPKLSLLAGAAQIDSFTKVKEMIDKMVAQLMKQQDDESTHRDWCIKDMNINERSTAEANDKKDGLLTRIGDLERTIDTLKKEIQETTVAIAEMQEQMKRASEVREAENADFQETVTDQRMTQTILKKATARMKDVYAFLQNGDEPEQPGASHTQTSGNHTDPGNGPARFTAYEKHAGGARVVALLEQVLKDSTKMENDAHAAELDAQSAYEYLMKDSNKAMAAYNKKVTDMRGAMANAKEELSMTNSDLKATMHMLKNLATELGDLKESCDFIIQTFDSRQAARTSEIEALRQAKAIVSGAT